MEEDIKILENKLKQWEPYKNTKFPTPIEKEIQKENRAIENLINKNKELEKERDDIYADYQDLGKEKLKLEEECEEQEKIMELMNEYILKNCVSLEICSKQIGKECYIDVIYGDECKECVLDYFRKKAKGD